MNKGKNLTKTLLHDHKKKHKRLILILIAAGVLIMGAVGGVLGLVFYDFSHLVTTVKISDYQPLPGALENYLKTNIAQEQNDYIFRIGQKGFYTDGKEMAYINNLNNSAKHFWRDLSESGNKSILDDLKSLLAKDNITFASISGFNNKLYVNYHDQQRLLLIAPRLLQSKFANDSTGLHDSFGQVNLIADQASAVAGVAWKYSVNFQYLVTFVLFDEFSGTYTETKLSYRVEQNIITTPVSVYVLMARYIATMQTLLPLNTEADPNSFEKQRFQIMQAIFTHFFSWNNHIVIDPGVEAFFTATPLLIKYDNRYLKAKTDLNAKLVTLKDNLRQQYQDFKTFMLKINANYTAFTIQTYNFNPASATDNYSGYVPGFDQSDDKTSWGSKRSTFTGGISLNNFWKTFTYQKVISYTQTIYSNNDKSPDDVITKVGFDLNKRIANILDNATYAKPPTAGDFSGLQQNIQSLTTQLISANSWLAKNLAQTLYNGFSIASLQTIPVSPTITKKDDICYYKTSNAYVINSIRVTIEFNNLPSFTIASSTVSRTVNNPTVLTRPANPDGTCPALSQQQIKVWLQQLQTKKMTNFLN